MTHCASNFRTDIQALRGFAVLLVLFYHAKIGAFPAGYLGVDIFFVISGFLITTLIKHGIESGTFRFSDFYFRRAKRLLPAAYVTFLATAALASIFLTSSEMDAFRMQVLGAVTFTANIVLWQQSGYFAGPAELKPLLHIWSLAIEEQYYLVLPVFLALLPRRLWLRALSLVLLASLALFLWQMGRDSTFYLLPTRAWELMIGSVGALIAAGARANRALKLAFWPALAALLLLPLASLTDYHPGPEALLICFATLVVILSKHPILFKGRLIHGLGKIGDISYSLYLVHWPLFAFFNNAWIGENGSAPSIAIPLVLIALSCLLAYLLHRFVEKPFRHTEIKHTVGDVGRTVAAAISLVLLTAGIAHATASTRDYAHLRRATFGLGPACDFTTAFEPISECRNSDAPEVLVWGDSYAMHLVPGILGTGTAPPAIVQATRSVCGPLMGIAPMGRDPGWAKHCIKFNESVLAYIQRTDSIRTVVLSSPFEQYVDHYTLLKKGGPAGTYTFVAPGLDQAVDGLRRTVDAVKAMGKRVVVVAPPPAGGFDIGRCIERVENHLPVLGVAQDCSISIRAYALQRGLVLDLLAAVRSEGGVEVVGFDDFLCDFKSCRTHVAGTAIYRDSGHLSYEGSVYLAKSVSLLEKIRGTERRSP